MTSEFWITTCAIAVGPLGAVLVTYFLQRKNDALQRRMFVFRTIMSTRRTPLSPERVQALNLVDIEFHKNMDVLAKFSMLLATYNDRVRWMSEDVGIRKAITDEVDDRTVLLLKEMGKTLGFKLENLDLLRGGYYPEAFKVLELQQNEIREFLVGLNQGTRVLKTAVIDVRYPPEILQQAREAQAIVSSALQAEEDNK